MRRAEEAPWAAQSLSLDRAPLNLMRSAMMLLPPRSHARCKKTLAVIAIAFLVFQIAAPSSLSAEKVTVLYSNATFTGTAMFVAKDAGLCKQRGVELELVLGGGSAPTVSAVVGGHVQFVQVSESSLPNPALQGGPDLRRARVSW